MTRKEVTRTDWRTLQATRTDVSLMLGLYKLFLQFAHEGRVCTVDFTTEILP